MQGRVLCRLAAVASLLACLTAAAPPYRIPDAKLSGPFAHDNLTIFLIHSDGKHAAGGGKFMTLAEAMQKKQFKVYETQNVNDLLMENLSDQEVILLSGDILKGGQQDRVVAHDRVVPPKSGKIKLSVFCVERTADRWMKPMKEEEKAFSGSPGFLATNSLRLACRSKESQSGVWAEVGAAQAYLARRTGSSVQDKRSDSSLALSLQAKKVVAGAEAYTKKLSGILDDRPDVVGYVFAVNDKVVAGDVYHSPALFRKVWPRLLAANAIEAFAGQKKDGKFVAPKAEAAQAFLREAATAQAKSHEVGKDVQQVTRESKGVVLFESQVTAPAAAKQQQQQQQQKALRTNYLSK